jgi:CubicO group peptidase (beta-lactamase class C family)
MQKFPADVEQQVTLANWRQAPFNQWAFHHVREIVPSADIANAPHHVWAFDEEPVNLGGVSIDCASEGLMSLSGFCDYAHADALLVLHRNKIVYEHYDHGMDRYTPHILMSVSKSILGIVVGILEEKGIVNTDELVTRYIPELSDTAYQGATLRHLLDMRTGVEFDEDYLATSGPIITYRKSTNWNPLEDGETATDLRSFLSTLTAKKHDHGQQFSYVSPNTDLLGWVIERATGQSYASVVRDYLWQPMGAEYSSYITVDRLGAPRTAGGVCTTLRDLARVSRLIINGGKGVNGKQVISEQWIADLLTNGDRDAWDNGNFAVDFPELPMSYRSKWYVLHSRPEDEASWLVAIGIHGQNIYIDIDNEFAMIKFASHALPLEPSSGVHGMVAAKAIRDYLVNHF